MFGEPIPAEQPGWQEGSALTYPAPSPLDVLDAISSPPEVSAESLRRALLAEEQRQLFSLLERLRRRHLVTSEPGHILR